MVLHSCSACHTTSSWRYHKLCPDLEGFFTKICCDFQINTVSLNHNICCHSCFGVLKRTHEFINKIKTCNETESSSSLRFDDESSNTNANIPLDSSSSLRFDEESSNTNAYIPLDRDNVINADHGCANRNPGVKRPHESDHSYDRLKSSLADSDHDYFCQVFGEDDDEEEADFDVTQDTLMSYDQLLPQTSQFKDFPSKLKSLTLYQIAEGNIFKDILTEMSEKCPELLSILASVSIKDRKKLSMRQFTSIVVAYSVLMFARNNRNSAFQRCLTMIAVKGNANDEFICRLNQMSLTLSCSGKLKLLDKAVDTSKEMIKDKLKTNPRCKITGDNLDMYIVTNHHRSDNQNLDIHWFASNLITTRLNYNNIPDQAPNVELSDIKPEMFVPNATERFKMVDVIKVMIGRIVGETDDFSWIKSTIPDHIPHRHMEYMSKKQDVFTLPIIFKNESKNEDCLDIMQTYEDQLIELFTNAYGNVDALDQNKVVLGGDQLTRERFQRVKNIRHIADTPAGRFDHLFPIVCEFWHVKQDLLEKAYMALYNPKCYEKGTLHHAKVILGRKEVDGQVKTNYKAHEDLLLLMVKALISVAAEQIGNTQENDRDQLLQSIYDVIHGKFCGSDDGVLNYYTNLIVWGLQVINMNDTAKEEHLLSPAMKLRVLEGAFVNTKGKEGKNKEADLVQEHSVRNKKDLIRNLGANKTEKAVMRSCSAADTCVKIASNLDSCLGITKTTTKHTIKASQKDLELLIKVLRDIKPYQYIKGRKFEAFVNIDKNPAAIKSNDTLMDGILKKIKRLFINYDY